MVSIILLVAREIYCTNITVTMRTGQLDTRCAVFREIHLGYKSDRIKSGLKSTSCPAPKQMDMQIQSSSL